jgi:hypothetical protein
MLRKILRWVLGAAAIAGAAFLMNWIYLKFIEDRLPADWQYTKDTSEGWGKEDALYWGILGLGTIPLVVLAFKLTGQKKKSPINPAASPIGGGGAK